MPLAMFRKREHWPQEEILCLLDQRHNARDLRIAESFHKLSTSLLSITANSFPAITGAHILHLHQTSNVDRVGLRVVVRGEQHAAAREVDGCAFEVDLEVRVDWRKAECVAETRVYRFALRLDMLETSDRMDAIAAHEQLSSS